MALNILYSLVINIKNINNLAVSNYLVKNIRFEQYYCIIILNLFAMHNRDIR